ncbi:MAG: anhydro-N-acetylmuramic acid kinase [Gammaproteobacteria bacterium]|nr:MAG: anhydro-N-acetylmuramic acid kinase [Gammaproteobacteria bacterium]
MTVQNKTDNLDELAEALGQTIFEDFSEGYYIGMMSGTSLDGLDAVVVCFNHNDTANPVKLIATHSKDFEPDLHAVLLALCQPNGTDKLAELAKTLNSNINTSTYNNANASKTASPSIISELDWFGWASKKYGEFASKVVNELMVKANITADDVLAIGCHGQTVRHRPQQGFTLQLVDANIIAEHTGISTITDFRRRDMAVGGQGAPLVPAFHHALFANASEMRVLLNLGGVANITVLPAGSANINGYDTGPANLLMDSWIGLHTGKAYDKNGDFARSGQVMPDLLSQLLTHPYFNLPAPKSTGREDFHLARLEKEIAKFAHKHPTVRYSPADIQATLTELTAVTACNEINQFYDKNASNNTLYICGGGAFNTYLRERITTLLPDWQVATTDALGLAPTWVESVAFAWLARQTLMGEVGNAPAVTGASRGVVLGQVCFG